jgi:hypothetical protein
MLIFSSEFVLGPETRHQRPVLTDKLPPSTQRTNGADNRRATILLGGVVVGVELRQPLETSAPGIEMIKCISHSDRSLVVEKLVEEKLVRGESFL